MEDYIGTIQAFAFSFAPRGWLPCNGQLLAIADYQALFSLLGTTYGGDGRTTFGLPDLRGHVAISQGAAPGFTNWRLGQKGGTESNILNVAQLPPHGHQVTFDGQTVRATIETPASNRDGTTDETQGNIPANSANSYAPASSADTTLSTFSAPVRGTVDTGNTGSSSPVNNMQPFLTINYCICIQGIYPPRD
ncbi:tail fiber protein [Winogradskyella sp. 3972H.M.0a.05]|uniref:phage tail protein n=1 Tax=Winogradskyella sp. 3972H.M.0a.05 TaxID=2950277 RepID=UPI003392AD6E